MNKTRGLLLPAAAGLLAGVLTRLTDLLPSGGLWAVSSIATLFGFWIVTVTLWVCVSRPGWQTAGRVLVYLLGMNTAFYGLKYLFGLFWPRFDGAFSWNLFFLYDALALVCAAVCFGLSYWRQGGRLGSVLSALPAGGLLAECIGVGQYLAAQHTFLFQFLFDLCGLLLLGGWFYRRAAHKPLYLTVAALTGAAGYLLVYWPFL